MINYSQLLEIKPYSLNKEAKSELFTQRLVELSRLHNERCENYHKLMEMLGISLDLVKSYEEIPFLPVRLFKTFDLMSVSPEEIFKTMHSSGTTGQTVSRIYLDRNTASNQQKTLIKIVADFLGKDRGPMLIIDCPSVVKDRNLFSARGAGILGFSIFASDRIYAFDDDMALQTGAITEFLQKHQNERVFVFGFTFIIWHYFYKAMKENNITLDLSNAVMIHGGGWKKLANEAVAPADFKKNLREICGIQNVHDYYGMVEQTGGIYMECEYGHLHSSIFSDVIVRRSSDFSVCNHGEKGIIHALSLIPESYPGHSLLTEDEGVILGEDDCPCGRMGKYFHIHGRIKNAEVRGCSDTFEER